MDWIWIVIAALAGLVLGVVISFWCFTGWVKEKKVGTLREDNSDPEAGPYLFLELDRGGLAKIQSKDKQIVCMYVNRQNYIQEAPAEDVQV